MSSFLKNISKSDAMLLLNGLPKLGPISLKKLLQEFENNPLEIINSILQNFYQLVELVLRWLIQFLIPKMKSG